MSQKEWVEYFKTLHGRPPTEDEFQQALTKGEFNLKPNGVNLKNLLLVVIFGFLSLLIVFGVINSLGFRGPYLNFSNPSVVYDEIITEYQDSIDSHGEWNLDLFPSVDLDVFEQIVEQPSRKPSAIQIDLNGDGKKELYIVFDDGADEYEILAAYQTHFFAVKRIDSEGTNKSRLEATLKKKTGVKSEQFDMYNLLTMNQEYLAEGDLSQIEGKRITDDGSHYSLEFDDEGITVLNVHMDNELYKNSSGTSLSFSEVQSGKFEGRFSIGQQELEFLFLPSGILSRSSDEYYDRIYFPKEDLYFYREDDIVYSGDGELPMDFVDMLYGDFVNVSGTWRNGEGDEIFIYSDGTVDTKWADDQEITSLSIQSERMTGVFGNGTHGTAIHFIPRGVTGRGLEDTDSDLDRVVIGDGPSSFKDPKVYYLEEDDY